jgi:hypothetical protein
MKYYTKEDFDDQENPLVPYGRTLEQLIQEVIAEYKLLPNNAMPSREMAEEIVELRVMCFQEGLPWPFSIPSLKN